MSETKQQTSKHFGNGKIDSKIAGLDFDRLRFKIVMEEGWSEEKKYVLTKEGVNTCPASHDPEPWSLVEPARQYRPGAQ